MIAVSLDELSKTERGLVARSRAVRLKAYAPYSRFKVGAVAVAASGRAYAGCNVESSDYTLTTHAEMNAINAMVSAGELSLSAIVVCLSAEKGPPVPCGLCRQKMVEFAGPEGVKILCVGLDAKDGIRRIFRTTLAELLPVPFSSRNLGRPGTSR